MRPVNEPLPAGSCTLGVETEVWPEIELLSSSLLGSALNVGWNEANPRRSSVRTGQPSLRRSAMITG